MRSIPASGTDFAKEMTSDPSSSQSWTVKQAGCGCINLSRRTAKCTSCRSWREGEPIRCFRPQFPPLNLCTTSATLSLGFVWGISFLSKLCLWSGLSQDIRRSCNKPCSRDCRRMEPPSQPPEHRFRRVSILRP